MIPLNISNLIRTSWKPGLQSHVLCTMQNALWCNGSYPNSNYPFPGNIILMKQSQLATT